MRDHISNIFYWLCVAIAIAGFAYTSEQAYQHEMNSVQELTKAYREK